MLTGMISDALREKTGEMGNLLAVTTDVRRNTEEGEELPVAVDTAAAMH